MLAPRPGGRARLASLKLGKRGWNLERNHATPDPVTEVGPEIHQRLWLCEYAVARELNSIGRLPSRDHGRVGRAPARVG